MLSCSHNSIVSDVVETVSNVFTNRTSVKNRFLSDKSYLKIKVTTILLIATNLRMKIFVIVVSDTDSIQEDVSVVGFIEML